MIELESPPTAESSLSRAWIGGLEDLINASGHHVENFTISIDVAQDTVDESPAVRRELNQFLSKSCKIFHLEC